MNNDLDKILSELDSYVSNVTGYTKQANITEKDVLGGDRTDTDGGGVPYQASVDDLPIKHMTDHASSGGPVEKAVEETDAALAVYDLSDEREKDALANPNTPVNKKAAIIANAILQDIKKQAEEEEKKESDSSTPTSTSTSDEEPDSSTSSDLDPDMEKAIEEEMSKEENSEKSEDETQSKEAGMRAFYTSLKHNGASFLHKTANTIDSTYKGQTDKKSYMTGVGLADIAFQKIAGADLADKAIQKQVTDSYKSGSNLADIALQKVAQDLNHKDGYQSYNTGAELADVAIQKVAADLVSVRNVIDTLMANGSLSQDEKNSLLNVLASSEVLTPEVIRNATNGLPNSSAIASTIINELEGPQGTNIVPQPAQPVQVPTTPPQVAGVDGEIAGHKNPSGDDVIEIAKVVTAALKKISGNV